MRNFWRIGFFAQLSLVALATVLAYTGLIPTHFSIWSHADWVGHAVGFGLLAFFLDGTLGHQVLTLGVSGGRATSAPLTLRGSTRGPHPKVLVRLAPVLILLGAAIEELAQGLSPRRNSSIGDFLADVIGVVVATWLAGRLTRYVARAGNARSLAA